MLVFAVSCAMEKALPAHRTATSFSRVRSPNAAKVAARASLATSALRCDMAGDVLHLDAPAAAVHPESFHAPARRHFVEAGLHYLQHRGVTWRVFERESHECRLLFAVIDGWVDGVGMPAEGQQTRRLDSLDRDLPH